MSQGPKFSHPFQAADEPLVAEVIPERPGSAHFPPPVRKGPAKVLVGCGIFGALALVVCCGGLTFVISRGAALVNPALVDPEATPEMTAERIRARLVPGAVPAADEELREISALLKQVESARDQLDRPALVALVDWNTRMAKFEKSYRFQPMDWLTRIQLTNFEKRDFALPVDASDFRVASIESTGTRDRLVYTYAQQGNSAHTPYVFHVRRSAGRWLLVDWMETPELRWSSTTNALGCGPDSGDRAGDEQRRFIDLVNAAQEKIDAGDVPAAERILRKAEAVKGIAEFRAMNLHLIAARWLILGKYDECRRVLALAPNPDEYPWLHYWAARADALEDRQADAIAAVERYEAVAGFHHSLAVIKAQAQIALKQTDSGENALALLRYLPNDFNSSHLALSTIAAERLDEAVQLLGKDEWLTSRIESAARSCLYNDNAERFDALRAALAKALPESSAAGRLDAMRLHHEGRLEEAVAKYEELIAEAADEEREELFLTWAEVGAKCYEPVALLERSKFPREAFAALMDGGEDEGPAFDLPTRKALIAVQRRLEPEDPVLLRIEGEVAALDRDWTRAREAYERALAKIPADEDWRRNYVTNELLEARLRLGEHLAAYREAAAPREAFAVLARLAVVPTRQTMLRELCAAHREREPSDPRLAYYELVLREAAADNDAAETEKIIQEYQQLAAAGADETDDGMYRYELQNRLRRLEVSRPDWRGTLAGRADFADLFSLFVERFERAADDEGLQAFLTRFRAKYPQNRLLLQHDLEHCWRREDYAGYVSKLTPWPAQDPSEGYLPEYFVRPKHVVSCLMLGRTDEARRSAETSPGKSLQMLVAVAAKDIAAARALLAEDEYFESVPGDRHWLRVPGVEAFLRSDDFRALQTEHPLSPRSFDGTGARITLLFGAERDTSVAAAQAALEAAGLEDVRIEDWTSQMNTRTIRIRGKELDAQWTVGKGKYHAGRLVDESLEDLQQHHAGWGALERLDDKAVADDDWARLVAALAAEGDRLWGVGFRGEVTVERRAALANGRLPEGLFPANDLHWLPNAQAAEEEPDQTLSWRTKCVAAVAGEPLPARVLVKIQRGNAIEHWPLRVTKVVHEGWGEYTVRGAAERDSVLAPGCYAGGSFQAPLSQIAVWEPSATAKAAAE